MTKPSDNKILIWGTLSAFFAYSCMFAFRRGISAATFEGMSYWGINYKIWLITAQLMGYGVSKGIGIKVVSEMPPLKRAFNILLYVSMAALALLGFAVVPAPYNIIFLFLNGLPLGLLYGTVLGFLEGRRQTDAMVAGLTTSFVFASGLVKDTGRYLLTVGVSEFWMPFSVCVLFTLPLLVGVWALVKLPPPTAADHAARTERRQMNSAERAKFVRHFAFGLVAFIVSYLLLSSFRDFRDNFGPEIMKAAGETNVLIFTKTETAISLIILLLLASLRWVSNNWQAFKILNILMFFGALLLGVSTWFYEQGGLSAGFWFMLTGVGLYLGYVPSNGLYFERMVASFRYVSTVSFVVTLADFYGYMGSVSVLLYKNFGQPNISFLDFFIRASYIVSTLYMVLIALSYWYFQKKHTIGKYQC
jgi:Family of unknown function (DUF5690)